MNLKNVFSAGQGRQKRYGMAKALRLCGRMLEGADVGGGGRWRGRTTGRWLTRRIPRACCRGWSGESRSGSEAIVALGRLNRSDCFFRHWWRSGPKDYFTVYFTKAAWCTIFSLWATFALMLMEEELPVTTTEMPLTGPPPSEVPLPEPPLVRVIAQVRFPLIASVEKREFIAPFQEAIRKDYPALRPEQSRSVVLGPQGVVGTRSNTVWRFYDAGNAWSVTLAPDFLALETGEYSSRDDFLRRFEQVLHALKAHLDPQVIDRLGVRYIDRILGDNLTDIAELVRPEIAGILTTPLAEHADLSISENVFVLPDDAGRVTARWGLVPARGTVDPGAVDPIEEASWLLDLDAFQVDTCPLDVVLVITQARAFTERIYSIFRWAVTDEFLRRYGGKP